ncbi:MAG TPA: sugar transferase [Terriglobales bacterium]|nr:sugar transferase [Terriglobales bacterium]
MNAAARPTQAAGYERRRVGWLDPGPPRKRPPAPVALALGRITDCLLCLLAAPLAAAIIAACAVVIRFDSPGPIFFRQWRSGRHGRRFELWKLRTMRADADQDKEELRASSEVPWPDFKLSRDPRVTRVGAWLRRTSLDELPQLWNIWRGEMTWVGPRPTSFSHEVYELWQTERLEVRPGLTGLWQVLERGQSPFPQRVRLDVAYVRARNWKLNAKIMVATIGKVWSGDGAK